MSTEPTQHGISHAEEAMPAFGEFVDTVAALRAPDGCPWDKVQTHGTIAKNMLEEAYEAVDAIEANDAAHLREELGDVLLQVVLQSQIAADAGEFTITEVIEDVTAKMVRRHPHIFGDAQAEDAVAVNDLWEQVKHRERVKATIDEEGPEHLLDTVPVTFPALTQAAKISKKAVGTGFEWDSIDDVWRQVESEIDELKEAYALAEKDARGHVIPGADDAHEAELELGDVFFSLVNVGRKMGLDSEGALRATCTKFRNRWSFMEGAVFVQGKRMQDLSVDQMMELWRAAKRVERSKNTDEA